jgi:HK97 gp10 family phage protein
MPAWGVELILDEVTPKLRGLTDRMKQNIIKEAGGVGAEMENMAKSLAAVRTGYMRDSVFHDIVESDLGFIFGAKADYAGFVEFGTRRSRAQPFIRPALDANQTRLVDAILKGVMNAFE